MKNLRTMSVWMAAIGGAACFVPAGRAADVTSFVAHSYDTGLPCAEAGAFGFEEIVVLDDMLKNPQFEPYWANIVATLGCIGDPSAVSILEDFVEAHTGEVNFHTYSALLEVPTALGFISFKGDEQALELLTSLAENERWRSITLRMDSGEVFKSETVQKNLLRSTIGALGYSGHPKAMSILEDMRTNPSYQKEYRDDINFAIMQ